MSLRVGVIFHRLMGSSLRSLTYEKDQVLISVLTFGFIGGGHGAADILHPVAYTADGSHPKKRHDTVFADTQTGFYGIGKGKLDRTQDGGQLELTGQ